MKNLLISLFVFSFFWACSSQVAFTAKKEADVDSVLFYQQKDVADPFIDTILTAPQNSAQISTVLLPPPPPTDTLKQIDGFRVQVFAGLDSLRGLSVISTIKSIVADTIYMEKEGGLFKVQVGDYPYRSDADSIQRRLTINNFAGTWVVARLINIRQPINAPDTAQPEQAVTNTEDYKFKIQILATSDESRALTLVNELQNKFQLPSFYLPSGDIYKVYLGKFKLRNEADEVLAKVRAQGYPDAWVVY